MFFRSQVIQLIALFSFAAVIYTPHGSNNFYEEPKNYISESLVLQNLEVSLEENKTSESIELTYRRKDHNLYPVSCSTSATQNLLVAEKCSCANARCHLKVKGLPNFTGTGLLSFTLSDNKGLITAPGQLTVKIFSNNHSPQIDGLSDLQIIPNTTASLNFHISDPEDQLSCEKNVLIRSGNESMISSSKIKISGSTNCSVSFNVSKTATGMIPLSIWVQDFHPSDPLFSYATVTLKVLNTNKSNNLEETKELAQKSAEPKILNEELNYDQSIPGGKLTTSALSKSLNRITAALSDKTTTVTNHEENQVSSGSGSGNNSFSPVTAVSSRSANFNRLSGTLTVSSIQTSSGVTTISWSAISGATSYIVYYGTTSGNYTEQVSSTANSATVTDLVPGTEYYFLVKAIYQTSYLSSSETSYIPIDSFSIGSITQSDPNTLLVHWDSVAGADTYQLSYGTSSGNYSNNATCSASPCQISGLTTGVTYYIMIQATNSTGLGASQYASAESSITLLQTPVLTGTSTNQSIALSWGSVIGATSYRINYGTSSGNYPNQVLSNTTSETISGLTPGQNYYFMVSAISGTNQVNSNEINLVPIQSFTESSVSLSGSNSVVLNWNSVLGATSYTVNYGTDGVTFSSLSTCSSSPCIINSLIAGTPYYFQVTASNSTGIGASQIGSNILSATPMSTPVISSVTTQGTGSGIGNVTITWSNPPGATGSNILYGTSSGTYTTTLTNQTSPTTISGLSAGVTYYFVIAGTNSSGQVLSSESSITVYGTFSSTFSFNNSMTYQTKNGSMLSSGATLIASNTVTQKTANGTGNATYNEFDNYSSMDGNLVLTNDMVQLNSGTSGNYISQPLDGMNFAINWNLFTFYGSYPYGKEIAASAESGYGQTVSDFSTNLVGLWHLNESSLGTVSGGYDFSDASGNGNYATHVGSGVTPGISGKLGNGVNLSASSFLKTKNSMTIANKSFTFSLWFKTSTTTGGKLIGYGNSQYGSSASYDRHVYMSNAGNLIFGTWPNTIHVISSPLSYNDGNWHHVVATQSTSLGSSLYVDGSLVASNSSYTSAQNNYAGYVRIGYDNLAGWPSPPTSYYFNGSIDEVAVWSGRSLTSSEVVQLYRRGANRVKFQLRTCSAISSNNCSGTVSSWTGPDGTSSTYFSDLQNNSLPTTMLGTVGTSVFSTAWNLFTSGFSSWASGSNGLNRYIQYSATLESDSSTYTPDLLYAGFGPSIRYSTNAYVYSTGLANISYKRIDSVSISDSCSSGAGYQFTPDGSNYYVWSGSNWVINSSGAAGANSKSVLTGLSSSQWNQFPYSSGSLGVMVYLNSSGTSDCTVTSVQVNGQR